MSGPPAASASPAGGSVTIIVSVVVASFRDRCVLDACIGALLPQCARTDVELIVARADTADAIAALARAYPTVRVIPLPVGSTLPPLRGAGLAAATGRIAALTEDHCVADAAWVATMMRYADGRVDAVGGGMDNCRPARALDWGAFFAEYGFYGAMSSRPYRRPGSTPLLTGANVAYARRVLADVAGWMTAGAWENVVHDRLRASRAVVAFEPLARVGQNLTYSFRAFAVERYRHGRDYARGHVAESPAMNRWPRIAAAFLLPPLLTYRVGRIAVGSVGRAFAFGRALPFTFAFLGAWAVGEAAGYLDGPSIARRGTDPR